jgi:GNAT superfamily N-acetyltransferase
MYRLRNASIRPLKDDELGHANEWAVSEEWNPGPCDGLVFNAADPGSLLALEVGGAPTGVISAVRMTPTFGFIGFFVLSPFYRRAPYGWMLVQASLERMGDRVIGADSVPERLRNYSHLGFNPRFRTVSFQGVAPLRPAPWHPGVECLWKNCSTELEAYDATTNGVSRGAFLRAWLALPESRALVFKRNGRICGIGAARRCYRGVRLGPFQADDPEAADALYDALVSFNPGEQVSIDCPETNPDATRLAQRKGLSPGATTVRLYRGEPPEGMPHRIYGLMSFALG